MSYRLHSSQIPEICFEINNFLLSQTRDESGNLVPEHILVEPENIDTFKFHIKSVFNSYVRQDKKITDQAIASMPKHGFAQEYDVAEMLKRKRDLAADSRFPLNEDVPNHLAKIILDILWHNEVVSDVFAEDDFLKRKIVNIIFDVLKRDQEVVGTSTSQQHQNKVKKSLNTWDTFFHEQTNKIYESAEKLGLGTYENISTAYEILPIIPQLKEYLKQIQDENTRKNLTDKFKQLLDDTLKHLLDEPK
jgi:hypothetical protein